METQETKLLVCVGVLIFQRLLVTLDLLRMRLVWKHHEAVYLRICVCAVHILVGVTRLV